jgi:antitoxin (DNA-binding transcriptional repressor) of toxin-antitoxin stability system
MVPKDSAIRTQNNNKIFNNACPAIIFANNRTARLIKRIRKDINSITTKNGIIIAGAVGLNRSKKRQPFCSTLNKVIPPKLVIEKKKATGSCAVIVNDHGAMPHKLHNNINKKM